MEDKALQKAVAFTKAIGYWLLFKLIVLLVNAGALLFLRFDLASSYETPIELAEAVQRWYGTLFPILHLVILTLFLLTVSLIRFSRHSHLLRDTKFYPIPNFTAPGILVTGICASVFLSLFLSLLPFPSSWTEAYQETVKVSSSSYGWLSFLLTVFLAPLTEEVLYRGLMYRTLRSRFHPLLAMALSSLIFGLDHASILQKIYAFFIGVLLCCLYERTHSLLPSLLFHIGFNVASYIVASMPEEMASTVYFCIFVGTLIVSVSLMVLTFLSAPGWGVSRAELKDMAESFSEKFFHKLRNDPGERPAEPSSGEDTPAEFPPAETEPRNEE